MKYLIKSVLIGISMLILTGCATNQVSTPKEKPNKKEISILELSESFEHNGATNCNKLSEEGKEIYSRDGNFCKFIKIKKNIILAQDNIKTQQKAISKNDSMKEIKDKLNKLNEKVN